MSCPLVTFTLQTNIRFVNVIPVTLSIITPIECHSGFTPDEVLRWKGPKWVWTIDESNPSEVSELIILDILGTGSWFKALQWFGRLKMFCDGVCWFRVSVLVEFICGDPFSILKSILTSESWKCCTNAGKAMGFKVNPFFSVNTWNVKHKVTGQNQTRLLSLLIIHPLCLFMQVQQDEGERDYGTSVQSKTIAL